MSENSEMKQARAGKDKAQKKRVDPHVRGLLGEIVKHMPEGMTRQELTHLALPGAMGTSTWDGWNNGTTESGPPLVPFQRFARAVGLDVRLVPQDAPAEFRGEGGDVPDEFDEVITKLKKLPPLRQGFLLAKLDSLIETELSRNPTNLDADQSGHRGQ